MSDQKHSKKRDERNPDEIERDIEDTRESLGDDLDDLSRRMSPENVKKNAVKTMDDVKEAAMDRVESVKSDVMEQTQAATERVVERVRENPMPAALLLGALGAGFVLMQARRGGGESHDRQRGFGRSSATGRDTDHKNRFGSDMGEYYGDSHDRDEDSFVESNGLLVGLGALAVGAAIGMFMPTSSDDLRRGRRKVREVAGKVGSSLPFTGDDSGSSMGGRGTDGIRVRERIRVNKSASELYRFWRNLENLPKVMSHLEEVTTKSGDRSHWKAKGPLNTTVEWDAVITGESLNESIAWRSESESKVPNEGAVRFRSVGPNKTDIIVSLTYHPPGGAFGDRIAKLFGDDPSQQISEDLETFKEEVEAGRMSLGSASTPGVSPGKSTI